MLADASEEDEEVLVSRRHRSNTKPPQTECTSDASNGMASAHVDKRPRSNSSRALVGIREDTRVASPILSPVTIPLSCRVPLSVNSFVSSSNGSAAISLVDVTSVRGEPLAPAKLSKSAGEIHVRRGNGVDHDRVIDVRARDVLYICSCEVFLRHSSFAFNCAWIFAHGCIVAHCQNKIKYGYLEVVGW